MKTRRMLPLFAFAVGIACCTSGCATRTTASGGRESVVLGGAVSVATNSFQPTSPATLDADTSKIAGKGDPSGKKISFLWGLITLHDY